MARPRKTPLVALGAVQMLLSTAMLAAGAWSIIDCKDLAHVSWGVFPGVALFVLGGANVFGFKCSPRLLLGLSIINFLMIGVDLVAIASGAIGIRCEVSAIHKPYWFDGRTCYAFAKELDCMANFSTAVHHPIGVHTDHDYDQNRYKGLALNGIVLATGLIVLVLCIAAAALAIHARTKEPPAPGSSAMVITVQQATEQQSIRRSKSSSAKPPSDKQTAAATARAVNIQNANSVRVLVGTADERSARTQSGTGSSRTQSSAAASSISRSNDPSTHSFSHSSSRSSSQRP